MKSHTTYLTFNTKRRHEIIDITDEVEKCRAAAGISEGMVLAASHEGLENTINRLLDLIPLDGMRKTVARRMTDSFRDVPHFYVSVQVNMDPALALRKEINASLDDDSKVSVNDLVIKAAAQALKQHPKVNSSWLGDRIRYNQHVHIGVAVAVDEGLLVPVVRFADGKQLRQIGVYAGDSVLLGEPPGLLFVPVADRYELMVLLLQDERYVRVGNVSAAYNCNSHWCSFSTSAL